MSPKPYDDGLFIEPAGDYDVVYGDYNATMGDGALSGKRPYLRLTSGLRNTSRPIGGEVRMRCDAAGSPLPVQFTWLKNLAPLEKSRRIRVRHRELSSRLVIVELDVLDSGYYQCSATNAAGSVNSTAVLRVSSSVSPSSSVVAHKKRPTDGTGRRLPPPPPSNSNNHHRHHHHQHSQQQLRREGEEEEEDGGEEDNDYEGAYDNYMDEEMKTATSSEDLDDPWRVPSSAAGPGYVPLRRAGKASDGRWLDGQTVRQGDCIAYRGEACAQFLTGKHVKVLVDREHVYDAEKDLLAALMTVRIVPGLSDQCRHFMHQAACYHMFKVCDPSIPAISLASPMHVDNNNIDNSNNNNNNNINNNIDNNIVSLCREDCDSLKSTVCPNEYSMAGQHDLVGDGPRALLPTCESLNPGAQRCLRILGKPMRSTSGLSDSGDVPASSSSAASHWCFRGFGTKYQGLASATRSSRPCVEWPKTANSEFNTITHPQLRDAGNHCRNPSRYSQFSEPWCYTNSPGSQGLVAEPCNVPRCPPNLFPELDDSHTGSNGSSSSDAASSFLESFSNFWHSLSAQSQLLAFTSALGALAFLLFLCAICCVCCCRSAGRRRRKHGSGCERMMGGCGGGGGGTLQQPESASSMLSGSLAQQQKLAAHHQPGCQQLTQQMLMHGCNGNAAAAGGGSTTLSGSDMNSAFYRKVRDERMRVAGADELLNPLLSPPIEQHLQHHHHQMQMAAAAAGYQQPVSQQMFEMSQQQQFRQQQQQQQQPYWENSGTLNSAAASSYPPPSGSYYAPQSLPSKSQQAYNSPHTSTEPPPAEPYQIAHIQERQLKFQDRVLGEDASTQLILGEWVGGMLSGATLQVALKTLRPNMPHIAAEQFREEVQAIGFFEHPNVLRLFGVSFLHGRELCAVFDYMVHGDLVEFLKVREPRGGCGDSQHQQQNDEQERQRNAEDFLRIGTQITAGMAYLAENGFVHRDLSARNCLVGDQQVIKICNFARMKAQYERDYYRLNASCRGVPLRWMAKEALNEGRYSQASDVYSFGVCLWEIYTYARQPYEGCTDEQVIQLVQEENYLAVPEFCPPAVYAQMVECFNAIAGRRPTFVELHSKFQKWCQSGQASALHMQQHRASSVHSGGSGSGVNSGIGSGGGVAGIAVGQHLHLSRLGGGGVRQLCAPSSGNVPSPAPNSTILAGNLGGGDNGQKAKLALRANGGISVVHSTPIAQTNNSQVEEKRKGSRPVPMARRRKAFTDEDDLDEEEDEDDDDDDEEDYSSDESRDN